MDRDNKGITLPSPFSALQPLLYAEKERGEGFHFAPLLAVLRRGARREERRGRGGGLCAEMKKWGP